MYKCPITAVTSFNIVVDKSFNISVRKPLAQLCTTFNQYSSQMIIKRLHHCVINQSR